MKIISVVLIAALGLTGCSTFSKSARRERAYEKYVRKSSMARVVRQSRFHSSKTRIPKTPPSAPIESTETGPQAIPAGN